jgi:hypothetical protein
MANPSTSGKTPMKMQMDMYDFGKPVDIAAPPSRQTVNMAQLMTTQG